MISRYTRVKFYLVAIVAIVVSKKDSSSGPARKARNSSRPRENREKSMEPARELRMRTIDYPLIAWTFIVGESHRNAPRGSAITRASVRDESRRTPRPMVSQSEGSVIPRCRVEFINPKEALAHYGEWSSFARRNLRNDRRTDGFMDSMRYALGGTVYLAR